MKRAVLSVVAACSLFACGAQEPIDDVELGLDEGLACPVPATYCASVGLSYTGCSRKDSSGYTCWNGKSWWGSLQAWFNVYPGSSGGVSLDTYSGCLETNNCTYSRCDGIYGGYYYMAASGKCKARNPSYEPYHEQHLVAMPSSPCFGYVECYRP